ncbi:hypothetical protein DC31_16955 [Microbacterium sp. CH12i]|uniref:RDD family protein n=1 Tax=Microbacterium sp. CH12i TaxID=1479651 RepID=UPI0004613C96|nr:RDD family protein [Microbacterium sp. CH12i]KDA05437.1 hypothetical protein DC31_16955 [Microbacterium sp. CH12i]
MTQLAFGTVAPPSRRAVAYIIDAVIAAGLGMVLTFILLGAAFSAGKGMLGVLAVGGPLVSLLLLGWFVVYTLMQSGKGSIGMRAQGLRLARETDGAPLGFGMTLLRNIIFGLAASIVVGYFTPLFDGSGRYQGWHDKVAKSVMLDARGTSAATAAPPTQAMALPPRPQTPSLTGSPQPTSAPPIPGLTPAATSGYAPPQSVAAPAPSVHPAPAAQAPPLVPASPAPLMPSLPTPVAPSAPALVVAPAPSNDDPLIAFVPGITQDAPPVRSVSEQPAVVAPAPKVDSSVQEETQLRGDVRPAPAPLLHESSDLEDTRISIPGHRLIFTWDDGTRVTVSRRTIFGRNPAPEQGAEVVSVRDETLSLSKTHFEAAAEASGGWIIDRHSTNGTAVVRDGHRIVCAPGEQVRIKLGDAIEIGDRIVTIGGYA